MFKNNGATWFGLKSALSYDLEFYNDYLTQTKSDERVQRAQSQLCKSRYLQKYTSKVCETLLMTTLNEHALKTNTPRVHKSHDLDYAMSIAKYCTKYV